MDDKELSNISIDEHGNLFIMPSPDQPYYIVGFSGDYLNDYFNFSPIPLRTGEDK